jgi:molybdopterin/thiamine biosynthesis adenylyltransferase
MSSGVTDADRYRAEILDVDDPDDNQVLTALRADPRIEFIDTWADQIAGMQEIRATRRRIGDERKRWAYYPWRRTVVSVLGPNAFRAVRLDRNRNKITTDEQRRLGELRIGVIGLSVGHAIAYTLAAEGTCGALRLADFDRLELSNLNRVPTGVFDLGVNKAVLAARRIAELDPYLPLTVYTSGLTSDTLETFLSGLDIVIEECDSLDMKILIREAARARRLPVLMATSDRGLVDVERFDLEPFRPILHGLLGDLDSAALATLTKQDKVPHILRILDAARLSPRLAASLVEVGHTLTTWPQLAGDVALGATVVAEAVRRIGLGAELSSGRIRIDIADALDELDEPPAPREASPAPELTHADESTALADIVAAAAIRAPSGGNVQPWRVELRPDSVCLWLVPERSSTMDIAFRGSAVAVGAALFNARVAAAAHHVLGRVEVDNGDEGSPLRAVVGLAPGQESELARLYQPMLRRETNRHLGTAEPLAPSTASALECAARREGARLRLLTSHDEIEGAATILGTADRIRYLTPQLHAEMFSELRWPHDASLDTGIDVRSLELDPGDLVTLDILRRPEVMAHLAQWDAGDALGDDTTDRIRMSAAVGVVVVSGRTLTDYARGGSAAEAVWISAQEHGLAVQPVSPAFLYAHGRSDLDELSPAYSASLARLQLAFRDLVGTEPGQSEVLVFRFCQAPPPSVRSRRRGIHDTGLPVI